MNTVSQAAECAAYNIPEVMARVGVGRDKLYRLIREGKLPARKLGRKTLILASDLEAFLEALPRLAKEDKPTQRRVNAQTVRMWRQCDRASRPRQELWAKVG